MQLNRLRDLVHAGGPFATVYLDASHDSPEAPHRLMVQYQDLRDSLAADGTDAATLEALDREVAEIADGSERPVGGAGRVLVASGGAMRLNEELRPPPDPPWASWAPIPDLLQLVASLPEPITTVVAVVDAAGADIWTDGDQRHMTGPDRPLHKIRGDGLSHYTIQHRVDEHRKHNITEMARAVDTEVTRHGADLLVLAGEVQSRSSLHKALGERSLRVAREVSSGGRAPGTDNEELARDVENLRQSRVSEIRRNALERLKQAGGRPGVWGSRASSPYWRHCARLRSRHCSSTQGRDGRPRHGSDRSRPRSPTTKACSASWVSPRSGPWTSTRRLSEPLPVAERSCIRSGTDAAGRLSPVADGVAALLRGPSGGS
jgi:hypothetical protein